MTMNDMCDRYIMNKWPFNDLKKGFNFMEGFKNLEEKDMDIKIGDKVRIVAPSSTYMGYIGTVVKRHSNYFSDGAVCSVTYDIAIDGIRHIEFGISGLQLRKVAANTQKSSFAWGQTMEITKVIFQSPATIVFWEDGTKTVVKCGKNEPYDPEKGLAMAIVKRCYGDKGNYYNRLKKWLPEVKEADSTLSWIKEEFPSGEVFYRCPNCFSSFTREHIDDVKERSCPVCKHVLRVEE